MKRRLNTLKGKKLVTGDPNLMTKDEICINATPNGVEVKEIGTDGKIKDLAGSSNEGGDCEEKEWIYYKLNRETNKNTFIDILVYFYDLYLAVRYNDGVTETTSFYSMYQWDDGDYAGYIRVPKQNFVYVSWSNDNSFMQAIIDKKYFKEVMLMHFPDIEEISKEEYYSIVTLPIEQYPKTELPTQ